MKTFLLIITLAALTASGQSYKVGNGKKYHAGSSTNLLLTVCGYTLSPRAVAVTNTVDCKLCLRLRKAKTYTTKIEVSGIRVDYREPDWILTRAADGKDLDL